MPSIIILSVFREKLDSSKINLLCPFYIGRLKSSNFTWFSSVVGIRSLNGEWLIFWPCFIWEVRLQDLAFGDSSAWMFIRWYGLVNFYQGWVHKMPDKSEGFFLNYRHFLLTGCLPLTEVSLSLFLFHSSRREDSNCAVECGRLSWDSGVWRAKFDFYWLWHTFIIWYC